MRTSLGVSPVHKFSSALTFFYYYTAESASRKMKRNPCPNWLTDWVGSTFPQLVPQEKSFFFWPHNKSALIDQARSVKMAASLFFVFLSTPTIKRRKKKNKNKIKTKQPQRLGQFSTILTTYLGTVYMEVGAQIGEITCGRSPHLTSKRDQGPHFKVLSKWHWLLKLPWLVQKLQAGKLSIGGALAE